MACFDFAIKHNLQYIEFDNGWYGDEHDDASDATTITVDPKRSKGPLDLHGVIKYAESKGVGIILYVNKKSLEKQLDEVLPLLKSWGVKGIKYGFVNVGSQKWTSWLHDAVRKAAANKLMVDIHDEYRPTGYSRTYPNLMTQEGIRGAEASADNTMVLKTLFVRMLGGAGDQTNCYFAERVDEKFGSHASQLAKSVCLYSPWQFLYWYDRPVGSPNKAGGAGDNDNYIIEVPELSFFDQVPTVWDNTKIIEGYPGEYAVVARKSGTTWFVGAFNGNKERNYNISLDFLDPNIHYIATIFTDNDAVATQTKVAVETRTVTSEYMMKSKLGKHEGMAIVIKRVI
jgi:alpha-glucosidase